MNRFNARGLRSTFFSTIHVLQYERTLGCNVIEQCDRVARPTLHRVLIPNFESMLSLLL